MLLYLAGVNELNQAHKPTRSLQKSWTCIFQEIIFTEHIYEWHKGKPGIILWMHPANERRRYNTQNNPW